MVWLSLIEELKLNGKKYKVQSKRLIEMPLYLSTDGLVGLIRDLPVGLIYFDVGLRLLGWV